jgi:hypothetical protein
LPYALGLWIFTPSPLGFSGFEAQSRDCLNGINEIKKMIFNTKIIARTSIIHRKFILAPN